MNCFSLSQTPIERTSGAKAYYHINIFSTKTKTTLIATVALGAIAGAIGVVALLSTMGVIPTGLATMGSAGALALTGSGYTLMVAGLATALVFTGIYCQRRKDYHTFLIEDDFDFSGMKKSTYCYFDAQDGVYSVYVTTVSDEKEIHLFPSENDQDQKIEFLKKLRYWIDARTGSTRKSRREARG